MQQDKIIGKRRQEVPGQGNAKQRLKVMRIHAKPIEREVEAFKSTDDL